MAGLSRAEWRLIFTLRATETFAQAERDLDGSDMTYSIGAVFADDGEVKAVRWNGPVFQIGMAPGDRITRTGSHSYTRATSASAVSNTDTTPMVIQFLRGRETFERTFDYHDGLRYRHLERITDRPDRLSLLIQKRPERRR